MVVVVVVVVGVQGQRKDAGSESESEWCGGIAWCSWRVSRESNKRRLAGGLGQAVRSCGSGKDKRWADETLLPAKEARPASQWAGWASSRAKQKPAECCSAPTNTL